MSASSNSDQPAGGAGGGVGDWGIDISTGTPILTYKNCSVIESEQAQHVLRLITAEQALVKDAERYQWFRLGEAVTVKCGSLTIHLGANPDYKHQYPAALDKAVDAAILAGKGGAS